MKKYSKFVCILAENINFLIPASSIVTAICCNGEHFFRDGQFVYNGECIPSIDFSKENMGINYCDCKKQFRTSLIFNNNGLFNNEKYFSLVTEYECVVLDIPYCDFSLFSDKFEASMKKIGLIACDFFNKSVYYLIDVEVFFKKLIYKK